MKDSAYRRWVMEKWFEHQEEVYTWGQRPPTDSAQYYRKYRWWLRNQYRREQADLKRKEEQRKSYGKYA